MKDCNCVGECKKYEGMCSCEIKKNHLEVYENMPAVIKQIITRKMKSLHNLKEDWSFNELADPTKGVFFYFDSIDEIKTLMYATVEGQLFNFNIDIEFIEKKGGVKPLYCIGKQEMLSTTRQDKKVENEKIPGKITLGEYEKMANDQYSVEKIKISEEDKIILPEVNLINSKHTSEQAQIDFMEALESILPRRYKELMDFITNHLKLEYDHRNIKVGIRYRDLANPYGAVVCVRDMNNPDQCVSNYLHRTQIMLDELLDGGINFHSINII